MASFASKRGDGLEILMRDTAAQRAGFTSKDRPLFEGGPLNKRDIKKPSELTLKVIFSDLQQLAHQKSRSASWETRSGSLLRTGHQTSLFQPRKIDRQCARYGEPATMLAE